MNQRRAKSAREQRDRTDITRRVLQCDAFHHRKAHADAHGNVGKRCILQLTDEEKQQKQNQLQPFLHGRADVEHSRHGVIAHQLRQKAADGACEKRDQHAAKNSRQQSPRLSFQQEYSQQRPADAGQQQIRPHDEPLPPCRPTLRHRQNKPSSTVEIRNKPLPASKRTRSHKKPP